MKKALICLYFLFSTLAFSNDFLLKRRDEVISPYTTNALTFFEIGAGLTLVSTVFEETLKDKLQPDVADDRPLKRSSKIGDQLGRGYPNALYILGYSAHSYFTHNELSQERSLLMFKTLFYAGATTDILKRLVKSRRPNGGKFSFPSGHATTAFAFSSVITMEHDWPWALLANGMALFVSVSRMNDNVHFLQDIIAGATIGSMYGVGLYYLQKKNDALKKKDAAQFLIYPTQGGAAALVKFRF